MESRQNDKKTFQVRLDKSWHRVLALRKIDTSKSIKELVEEALNETYGFKTQKGGGEKP